MKYPIRSFFIASIVLIIVIIFICTVPVISYKYDYHLCEVNPCEQGPGIIKITIKDFLLGEHPGKHGDTYHSFSEDGNI